MKQTLGFPLAFLLSFPSGISQGSKSDKPNGNTFSSADEACRPNTANSTLAKFVGVVSPQNGTKDESLIHDQIKHLRDLPEKVIYRSLLKYRHRLISILLNFAELEMMRVSHYRLSAL